MSANKSETSDEMAIRHLVENWARAVRSKNLKGILANHFAGRSVERSSAAKHGLPRSNHTFGN